MGTQNKEIKVALDISAKIDKASNQINSLKKQIDNFELSKGLAGDFAKEFKNIEHELAELQRKTASGEINLIDAKAAEKEIDKIEKRWAFLLSKIGGEGFLEKGLKTDAQAIAALESLAQSYAKSIKEAELQESKLNKRLEEAKQHQKELNEAQKEQKVVKASELEDQKAQLALLQQQEKAAKKARDDAEKALRTKVEESGGKYSMDQASQKGSPLRKTDAYRTFRQAQSTYETAKANTKTQKANVSSMVTKEMQVAEATAAKEAIDKATEALENYRKTVLATAKEDAFEKAKESLKSISEFKDINWEGLGIDLTDIKSVEGLEKALAKLRIEANGRTDEAIKEMETSAKEAGQGFQGLEVDVKNAEASLEELDEQARQTEAFEARIKQFLGMAGAVELLRRALRQAFETTKELDAAMTEMAVVTDLEVGDYWKQLPDHTKRASELGVAIHSVYEAETLYYQQGLKTAEAQELANTTLRMARIAGLDAAEATDKMTAALRGFNMELNEQSAEKVADVYSELAAITAADVNEISSAMTKTASIASSAGMEFETTAAFLSQIIETTRESAETAGTAMKTVIARFSEVKKLQGEGLLTGQDEEGEVIDVNKIQTALRTVGISMDEFFAGTEGLDSIFLKLAEKWDTLDVKTQRYIATTAAGSRQQSRFIAMMSDYARTQELVTAANNSAGASQRQYEKTLESLESKLAKLKNAWDEFSMGILQSDLVKFGVDALTKFLEIINKATSALDGMGGTITKVLTTIALFKLGQKIFEGIKTPMANFFTKLVKDVYGEGIKAGQAFVQGLEDSKKTENQKKEEEQRLEQEKRAQYLDVKEDKSLWQKTKEATGISQIQEGLRINEEKKASSDKLKLMNANGGKKKLKQNYLNAKKEFEDIDKRLKNGEIIDQAEVDKATDSLIKAEDALVDYKKTEEEVKIASQKSWEQIGEGVQKLGTTISTVGIGVSVFGGILSSLGLEEVGEGFAKVGNFLTLFGAGISAIGTALTAIPPLLTLISTHPIIAIVVSALAVILASIMAIIAAVKKDSPEAQLKKAEEAAEKASEAADQATESYENLKDSLSELGEQYKTLEKLTQGTKEWNEAILEINNSVLDLIEKYPELAQYVKSQDGYLSLDIGSDEVQQVIKSVQASALLSKNASALANSKVGFAESQVVKKNYNLKGDRVDELSKQIASGEIIIRNEAFASGTKTIESLGYTTEQLEELYRQNSDNIAALREYGNSLLSAEAQQKTGFSSMVLSAQQMANTEGFTNKMLSISSNIVQESSASQIYEKELSKISSINYTDDKNLTEYQKQERDMAVKQVYGQDVKIEDLTNEQIQSAIAQTKAVTDVVNSINNIPIMLSTFAEQNSTETTKMLNNLLQDWEGGEMSMSDYNHLAKMSTEELKKIYKDLGINAKKIFGSEEAFLKKIEGTKKILSDQNKSMKTSIEAMFGKDAKIPNWNIPPEIGNQLLLKFQEVFNKADPSTFKTFYDQFNTVMSKLTEEDQRIFSSIFESIDWSNTADLANLPDQLNQAGLNLQKFGFDLYDFIDNVAEASHAIAKLSAEELSKVLGDVSDLVNNINKGEQGRVVSEEQYKGLLYADPTLQKEFAKVSDGYMYLGNSMNDLAQAVIDNTKTLKGEDADTAEKALAVFDAVETVANEQATKKSNYDIYAGYDEQIANYNAQIAAKEARIDGIGNPDPGSLGTKFADFVYWFSGGTDLSQSPKAVATELSKEKQTLQTEKAELVEQKNWAEQNKNLMAGYAKYGDYKAINAEAISTWSRLQLTDFLTSLDAKSDLSSLNISGLTDGYDFNQMTDEVLKNMVAQIFQAMGNKTYYEGLASTTPDIDIGNDIIAATLGGSTSLSDWYATEYASHEQGGKVLKGSMIQLTSNLGISAEILSQYLDENGEVITKKFDEFIALISQKEFEQKMAIPKEQTIDLINQVKDALIEARQKEIDDLASSFDAIAEANNKIVDAIQDWVAEDRQRRKNEETEQNITDKRNRLAYLSMDTSGNNLEILNLEEEIRQAEQDYQDDLIDQSIQKLQDANEIAQTQRENQISLLQSQLDFWKESDQIWGEVNTIIVNSQSAITNSSEFGNTELGQLLNSFSGNLSPEERSDFVNNLIELLGGYVKYNAYATGGIADFTGPAWLDGTKSHPELVLNARDTENFIQLKDILSEIMNHSTINNSNSSKQDTNYIDIDINVDSIANDYDVEQMADKIRSMLYEDATYRNVNSINLLR